MPEPDAELFEKIVSLAKRRGFVFQSAEIYGGFRSTYDYGPLGVLMLRNVKDAWWRSMVQLRHDVVGIDASILSPPPVWEASGHLANFTDPLVDCKSCNERFREDTLDDLHLCPNCGAVDSFTEPRQFNLMFKTHAGPVEDDAAVCYLRPETAQGMFTNFKNVLQTSRKKPPFGIAQVEAHAADAREVVVAELCGGTIERRDLEVLEARRKDEEGGNEDERGIEQRGHDPASEHRGRIITGANGRHRAVLPPVA